MPARRDPAGWARRLRRRVTVTAAVVFLLLWSIFMATALTGAGCRSATRDEDRRLRLCTVSIALRPFSPARFEPHKTASTDLERALIRAHRGDLTGARRDMQRALDAVGFGAPTLALAELGRHDAAPAPGAPIASHLSFLAALQARIDSPRTPAEGRALWDTLVAE